MFCEEMKEMLCTVGRFKSNNTLPKKSTSRNFCQGEHGISFLINALRLGDLVLVISKKQKSENAFSVSAGLLSVPLIKKSQSKDNLIAPICSFLTYSDPDTEPEELTPFAFKFLEIIALNSPFFITRKELFDEMVDGIKNSGTIVYIGELRDNTELVSMPGDGDICLGEKI